MKVMKWMFWIVSTLELVGRAHLLDSKRCRFKCNRRSSATLLATAR